MDSYYSYLPGKLKLRVLLYGGGNNFRNLNRQFHVLVSCAVLWMRITCSTCFCQLPS